MCKPTWSNPTHPREGRQPHKEITRNDVPHQSTKEDIEEVTVSGEGSTRGVVIFGMEGVQEGACYKRLRPDESGRPDKEASAEAGERKSDCVDTQQQEDVVAETGLDLVEFVKCQ